MTLQIHIPIEFSGQEQSNKGILIALMYMRKELRNINCKEDREPGGLFSPKKSLFPPNFFFSHLTHNVEYFL